MKHYSRYAVYYAPPPGPLAAFGAAWLGWDAVNGRDVAQPDLGLPLERITRTPRKYGFHGTLKPPFRLAEGRRAEALIDGLGEIAAGLPPVKQAGLRLARLGQFLALVPSGETAALAELAARVVRGLDDFRALPEPAELERRRAVGLSKRQEALLDRWGYPYVLEEFRFHLTLTGRLDDPMAARTEEALETALAGLLPVPFEIRDLCLFGEGAEDGRFRLISRVRLGAA